MDCLQLELVLNWLLQFVWFFFLYENVVYFKEQVPCSIANEIIEKKVII